MTELHTDHEAAEQDWEDVKDEKPHSPPRTPAMELPPQSPKPSSVRKRTIHVATPSRKPLVASAKKQTPVKPRREPRPPLIDKDEWIDGAIQLTAFSSKYAFNVLSNAVLMLRKPLSLLLFLWLLAVIMTRVSSTFSKAFAPLCYVPGMSRTAFCSLANPIASGTKPVPKRADYPRMVQVQSTNFEQLLQDSAGGSGLSLEIKKAEMATTDLATLVRVSKLHSRGELADSLVKFVEEARITGRGLQKLNAKIEGAVDSVLAVNDYALHAIESANSNTPSIYSKAIRALVPWSTPDASTEEIVTSTFINAMTVLSSNLNRLIVAAEMPLQSLDRLEERLATVHEIVAREDSNVQSNKAGLLANIWTRVGGNRRELRSHDEHLKLLNDLGEYRKRALVHVVGALQTLSAMSEEMEDLRERVAAPELVGGRIPVEVHMRSIKTGLERLRRSREGRLEAQHKTEEALLKALDPDEVEDYHDHIDNPPRLA